MFLVSLDRCCCWWKWCLFAFRAGYQLINETSSRWCLFPKVDPWIYPLPKSTRSQLLWLGMAQWLKMNLLKVGANRCLKMLKGSIRMFNGLDASLGWFCSRVLQSLIAIHGRIHWQQQIRCQDAHILVLWWQGWALGCTQKNGRPVVQQLSTSPLGSRGPAEPQLDPRPWHGVLRIRDGRTGPAHYPSDVPRTQNAGDSKPFLFMKPGLIFHVGHLNEGNPNADFMMIIAGESQKILVWKTDSIFGQAMTSLSPNGGCLVANPVKSVTIDLPSGNLTEFNRKLLNMAIYSGFTHQKWWFSIVMLVYQRVQCIAQHVVHMCIFSLTMLDTWKMPESHHSGLTTISLKMVDKSIHLSVMPTGFGVYYYCIYDIYILYYVLLYCSFIISITL